MEREKARRKTAESPADLTRGRSPVGLDGEILCFFSFFSIDVLS